MARERTPNQPQGQYDESSGGRNQLTFPMYIGEVMDVTDVEVLHRVSVYIPELGGKRFKENISGIGLKSAPSKEDSRNWITCQTISPLLASTSRADTGKDSESYMATQKSYGLFLPIPDIHVTVVVGFPGGDISQGIILGTIPDDNKTFTIPGIPWTRKTNEKGTEPEDCPGGERNWRHVDDVETHRPAHDPMTRHLETQGLLLDGIRGTSTSGSHRAYPYPTKAYGLTTPAQHHFIMDDGYTKLSPKEASGPRPHWNPKPGFVGQHNCLVRLRTAGGAQILLHDTEKLIYVITPDGKTWLEMSDGKPGETGKIDVYSSGDISFNAEESINLRAGDKVSIEAQNEVRVKSKGEDGIKVEAILGSIDIRAKENYNVSADKEGNILCAGNYKETAARIDMNGPPAAEAAEIDVITLDCNKTVPDSICNRVPEHEPWDCHFIEEPTLVMPYGIHVSKVQRVAPPIAKDKPS